LEEPVNHDTVVEAWHRSAQQHDDENYEFLRSLKFREHGYDPDELAAELHKEAFQIVDCTRCANCCKTMEIKLSDEDIGRIAGHLNMVVDEFFEGHLESYEEDGPYKLRHKQCPFLDEDDHCNIYDVRPSVCREYPHTDKEGFTFRTMGIANNALTCPAVFWIVEEMKKRSKVRRRKRRRRRRL
jgi:Fe-S-cluster containining protein